MAAIGIDVELVKLTCPSMTIEEWKKNYERHARDGADKALLPIQSWQRQALAAGVNGALFPRAIGDTLGIGAIADRRHRAILPDVQVAALHMTHPAKLPNGELKAVLVWLQRHADEPSPGGSQNSSPASASHPSTSGSTGTSPESAGSARTTAEPGQDVSMVQDASGPGGTALDHGRVKRTGGSGKAKPMTNILSPGPKPSNSSGQAAITAQDGYKTIEAATVLICPGERPADLLRRALAVFNCRSCHGKGMATVQLGVTDVDPLSLEAGLADLVPLDASMDVHAGVEAAMGLNGHLVLRVPRVETRTSWADAVRTASTPAHSKAAGGTLATHAPIGGLSYSVPAFVPASAAAVTGPQAVEAAEDARAVAAEADASHISSHDSEDFLNRGSLVGRMRSLDYDSDSDDDSDDDDAGQGVDEQGQTRVTSTPGYDGRADTGTGQQALYETTSGKAMGIGPAFQHGGATPGQQELTSALGLGLAGLPPQGYAPTGTGHTGQTGQSMPMPVVQGVAMPDMSVMGMSNSLDASILSPGPQGLLAQQMLTSVLGMGTGMGMGNTGASPFATPVKPTGKGQGRRSGGRDAAGAAGGSMGLDTSAYPFVPMASRSPMSPGPATPMTSLVHTMQAMGMGMGGNMGLCMGGMFPSMGMPGLGLGLGMGMQGMSMGMGMGSPMPGLGMAQHQGMQGFGTPFPVQQQWASQGQGSMDTAAAAAGAYTLAPGGSSVLYTPQEQQQPGQPGQGGHGGQQQQAGQQPMVPGATAAVPGGMWGRAPINSPLLSTPGAAAATPYHHGVAVGGGSGPQAHAAILANAVHAIKMRYMDPVYGSTGDQAAPTVAGILAVPAEGLSSGPVASKPAPGATLLPVSYVDWSDPALSSLTSVLTEVSSATFNRRQPSSKCDPVRQAYLAADIVPHLVELVRLVGARDRISATVLEVTIQVLCNLAYHPGCQLAMTRAHVGVVEVLLDRMRADMHGGGNVTGAGGYTSYERPNVNVHLKIARAIDALCWENQPAQQRAVALGGIELAVDSLRLNSYEAHAVLNLCRMLCTIARTVDAMSTLYATGIAEVAGQVQAETWATGWQEAKKHYMQEQAKANKRSSPGKLLRLADTAAGPRAAAGLTLLAERAKAAWNGSLYVAGPAGGHGQG